MAEPLIRGILYCNYKANGWSEVYALKETDMVAAEQTFRTIAGLRTAWFGAGVSLVWARVATAKSPRDGLMCQLDFPLGPYDKSTGLAEPEDPFTGIMWRFAGANFRWANRILRGVPDSEIQGNDWIGGTFKFLNTLSTPPISWPTTATVTNARKGFFSRIIGGCCMATPAAGVNFNKVEFTLPIVYRKITRRATGRPFGTSRGRAPAHVGG